MDLGAGADAEGEGEFGFDAEAFIELGDDADIAIGDGGIFVFDGKGEGLAVGGLDGGGAGRYRLRPVDGADSGVGARAQQAGLT